MIFLLSFKGARPETMREVVVCSSAVFIPPIFGKTNTDLVSAKTDRTLVRRRTRGQTHPNRRVSRKFRMDTPRLRVVGVASFEHKRIVVTHGLCERAMNIQCASCHERA